MAVRFSADAQDYTRTMSLGTLSAWSVTCWLKISTDRNAVSTAWNIDGADGYYALQTGSDGTTLGLIDIGRTHGSRALTVGGWYYVGVSESGANGTLMTRAADEATFTTTTWTNGAVPLTGTNLKLGESVIGGEWLNGCLAAVKLWAGAALSANELEVESYQYRPARTSSLRAWYPLTAAATVDYSGNTSTLSGGSGTATEDGPPIAWRQGRRRIIAPTGPSTTPVDASDTATLTESADLTTTLPVAATDTATTTDSAALTATAAGTDTGTLTESASISVPGAPEPRTPTTTTSVLTEFDCDAPDDIEVGDGLYAWQVADRGLLDEMATPTGGSTWELLDSFTNESDLFVKLWWKALTGSEPSTYGFTQSNGADGVVVILPVAGGSTATPVAFQSTAGADLAVTAPGVTPFGPNDLLIHFGTAVPAGPTTWEPPPGDIEQADTQSRVYATGTVATRQLTSAAPVGDTDFTASQILAGDRVGFTVAVAALVEVEVEPKTGTDTGALTDAAALSASSPAADTAALTDAAALTADASHVDSATFTDAATLAAVSTGSDSATLAETSNLAQAITDTGTLADNAALTATAAAADSGTLTDTSRIGVAATDAGTLADTAALTAAATGTDSATMSDTAALVVAQAATDSATATDTAALASAASATDSAALVEQAATTAAAAGADTGTLADTAGIAQQTSDSATLADASTLTAAAAGTDTASSTEAATIGQDVSDTGMVTDTAALTAGASGADQAELAETADVTVTLAATDEGLLTDSATLSGSENPAASDTAVLAEQAGTTAVLSSTDTAALAEQTALTATAAGADTATLGETADLTVAGVLIDTDDTATLTDSSALLAAANTTDQAALADTAALASTLAGADTATLSESAAVTAAGTLLDADDQAALDEQAALLAAVSLTDQAIASFIAAVTATTGGADTGTLTETAHVSVAGEAGDITVHVRSSPRVWSGRSSGRGWSGRTSRGWTTRPNPNT